MAEIAGVDPIIEAALESLVAEFPDQVAAFNANPSSPVQLELPAEYAFGAAKVMEAYPVLEVNALDGNFGPFAAGEAGVGEADSIFPLTVVLWLQGVTGEVSDLYRAGLAYMKTIVEILCVGGALGDTAEVSGTRDDAIRWRIDVISGGPDSVDRELRVWRLPVTVTFMVEAVEVWT